jgi:hypothetical protein
MTTRLLITLALLLGFIPQAIPLFTPVAEAAQQQVKKKKKKANDGVKKNFNNGGDSTKIPAGMSDYCLETWLTERRMRVGCDKYGHSFRLFDR